MVLGVVLHSAQIYNPKQSWAIYSENSLPIAGYLVSIINTFRMPSFFVISGFFCLLTLEKYGFWHFLSNKARRIIIPLVSTAVLLNSLQIFILSQSGWYDFDIFKYLNDYKFISHLWFLNNLIIYFLITAFFCRFLQVLNIKRFVQFNIQNLDKSPFLFIFIMPFFSVFILSLNYFGFPLYSSLGFFCYYVLLKYSPYFIFGLLLWKYKNIMNLLSEIKMYALFFLILVLSFIKGSQIETDSILWKAINTYLDALLVWIFIFFIFAVFMKYFNQKSNWSSYLSSASYTIYLFHHVLVIIFGLFFIDLGVSPLLGLIVIVLLTSFVTVLIHNYLISRYELARALFNGR